MKLGLGMLVNGAWWVGGEADMIYKDIWKCMEICDIIG